MTLKIRENPQKIACLAENIAILRFARNSRVGADRVSARDKERDPGLNEILDNTRNEGFSIWIGYLGTAFASIGELSLVLKSIFAGAFI